MAAARAMEAKSLLRRAIRACRVLPVRHISEKLELNVKLASHYLIRLGQGDDPDEMMRQGRESVRGLESLSQQPRHVLRAMLRKNAINIWSDGAPDDEDRAREPFSR